MASEIPPDAEKLLFAADIIIYFLNDRHPELSSEFGKTKIRETIDSLREHVQKRFSENIKRMITVIDETQSVLVRRDFLEIKNQDGINLSSLLQYNDLFKDCHFAKGFQARNFLMYCARIAVMACNFFSHGMKDALDVAIDLIKSAFTDEAGITWDSLENAAWKYVNVKGDFSGSVASFLFKREPTDAISSETEESSNSSTMNSESDSVTEIQNMASASSAESISSAVTKMDFSNTECANYVRFDTDKNVTASENLQSKVLNPLESPSTSSFPFALAHIEKSIRNAFLTVGSTSESSSSVNTPPKTSTRKSCLGKRPSPGKRQSSDFHGAGSDKESPKAAGDDSETEIKKTRLSLPEDTD